MGQNQYIIVCWLEENQDPLNINCEETSKECVFGRKFQRLLNKKLKQLIQRKNGHNWWIVIHQSAFKIKGQYIFLIESLYYSKENKAFFWGTYTKYT
jgi:hypothetical protein